MVIFAVWIRGINEPRVRNKESAKKKKGYKKRESKSC